MSFPPLTQRAPERPVALPFATTPPGTVRSGTWRLPWTGSRLSVSHGARDPGEDRPADRGCAGGAPEEVPAPGEEDNAGLIPGGGPAGRESGGDRSPAIHDTSPHPGEETQV